MSRKEKHSKKQVRIFKWVLISIPIFFILVGATIVIIFGWEMTRSTANLARTVVLPYRPDHEKKTFDSEYWSTIPKPGQDIGTLSVASLDLSYPVVQGTRDDVLDQGIGHLMGTLLPGQGGHVVLSGHRDTVFRKLGDLEIGDEVTFTTVYGDFVYETVGFDIVPAGDTTVAVPKDYEALTLTTCYPFNFIGSAPERYVVYTEIKEMPK